MRIFLKRKFYTILFILLAAGLWGAGNLQSTEPLPSSGETQAIANGDHKALAQYYREQAEKYRQVAKLHKEMKYTYRHSHRHSKGYHRAQSTHCLRLYYEALKMAKTYEALAKDEEKLAETGK